VAIDSQPQSMLIGQWTARVIGPCLIATGNVLVLSSMYQLGITGTYLGDYFGILMEGPVTSFPFNVTEHPMYEGASMIFFGYAFWSQSLAGVMLSFAVMLAYKIASGFEG